MNDGLTAEIQGVARMMMSMCTILTRHEYHDTPSISHTCTLIQ